MAITVATIHDIPFIQKIAEETWPVAYGDILSQEQLRYMLDMFYSESALKQQMQQGQTFLFEPKGAFASYEIFPPSKAKIHKLYVHPSLQSSGIGRALIIEIETILIQQQIPLLHLNVNRNNKAVDFYKKMGFIIAYEEDIDIGNNYFMNDYVMEKKLITSP